MFAGQGVQDAINNPFVFRRIPAAINTILLDTWRSLECIAKRQRYAIRVRATGSNLWSPGRCRDIAL
jgi:hypothetical protein